MPGRRGGYSVHELPHQRISNASAGWGHSVWVGLQACLQSSSIFSSTTALPSAAESLRGSIHSSFLHVSMSCRREMLRGQKHHCACHAASVPFGPSDLCFLRCRCALQATTGEEDFLFTTPFRLLQVIDGAYLLCHVCHAFLASMHHCDSWITRTQGT